MTPAPTPNSTLSVKAGSNTVNGSLEGDFKPTQKLGHVVILDVKQKPSDVKMGSASANFTYDEQKALLNVTALDADLSSNWSLSWS